MAHTDMAGTQAQDDEPVKRHDRQGTILPGSTPATASYLRLDLKALRMAVHGWWLGNPLVYKPGAPDLAAIARELAASGAASGTLVVSDAPPTVAAVAATTSAPAPVGRPSQPDLIEAVLILRSPLPLSSTALVETALQAVADTAKDLLGPPSARAWAIHRSSEVVVGRVDDERVARLCLGKVEAHAEIAYLSLTFALRTLLAAGCGDDLDGCSPADGDAHRTTGMRFFARPDWREVYLARVLHALEGRLKLPA